MSLGAYLALYDGPVTVCVASERWPPVPVAPAPRPDPEPFTAMGAILKVLKRDGPLTSSRIAARAGLSPSYVRGVLPAAVQAGAIARRREGGASVYRLTREGRRRAA